MMLLLAANTPGVAQAAPAGTGHSLPVGNFRGTSTVSATGPGLTDV